MKKNAEFPTKKFFCKDLDHSDYEKSFNGFLCPYNI